MPEFTEAFRIGGVGVTGAADRQAAGMTTRGVLAGTRLGFTITHRPANHAAGGVIFAPLKIMTAAVTA